MRWAWMLVHSLAVVAAAGVVVAVVAAVAVAVVAAPFVRTAC